MDSFIYTVITTFEEKGIVTFVAEFIAWVSGIFALRKLVFNDRLSLFIYMFVLFFTIVLAINMQLQMQAKNFIGYYTLLLVAMITYVKYPLIAIAYESWVYDDKEKHMNNVHKGFALLIGVLVFLALVMDSFYIFNFINTYLKKYTIEQYTLYFIDAFFIFLIIVSLIKYFHRYLGKRIFKLPLQVG